MLRSPTARFEGPYFAYGAVAATVRDLETFVVRCGIQPNMAVLESFISSYTAFSDGTVGGAKGTLLPLDVCAQAAEACEKEILNQERGGDTNFLHEAWLACGGDIEMREKIRFRDVADVVGSIGLPARALQDSPQTGSTALDPVQALGDIIDFRQFRAFAYVDDQMLKMVARHRSIISLEKSISHHLSAEQARRMRGTLHALMRFKKILRRIKQTRRFTVTGQLSILPPSDDFVPFSTPLTSPKSTTTPTPMNRNAYLDIMRRAKKRGAESLPAIVAPESFERTFKEQEKQLKRRRAAEHRQLLEKRKRTHPHSSGENVVRMYSSTPALPSITRNRNASPTPTATSPKSAASPLPPSPAVASHGRRTVPLKKIHSKITNNKRNRAVQTEVMPS